MLNDLDDPYRPYVAADDGRSLVLRRERGLGDWLMRIGAYALLLLVLGLFALIPYAVHHRAHGVKDYALAVVFLLMTWFVFKLVVVALRIEGLTRVDIGPGGVTRRTTGVLLGARERITGVTAVVATAVTRTTPYGPVRWLGLRARTAAGLADLVDLHLDRDGDPAREAAARRSAAAIAARLGVPLELDGQR